VFGKIVGIDLGTTFSAIAHINQFGVPEVIPNAEGERITPSVILFEDNEIMVGTLARQNAVAMPDKIVEFVKREMGRSVDEYSRGFGGKVYSAEQLSSLILRKLKEDAEAYLGCQLSDAVITVPAYFNEFQRAATVEAGRLAGFNVHRIINEPTAAALAFGVNKADMDQKAMVFDLGGGTFDVTIMEIKGRNIQMVATNGDHRLGGKDWDDEVIKYVAGLFEEEYGIDPLEDLQAYQDLQAKSVQAKILLSSRPKAMILFGYKGKQLKIELTEEKFRELTVSHLEHCKTLMEVVLDEASLKRSQIDTVLLTGGSTRMPMVKSMLRTFFKKEPNASVNPDEVVSLGAAIEGAMLQVKKGIAGERVVKMLGGITSQDVNSHSLGIVTLKEGRLRNSIIIPKNTPIPTEMSRNDYVTSYNNQTSLDVYLTQGEEADPRCCTLLGAYEFNDIPPRPAGKSQIEVTFKYNLNGMVEIEARDISSGKRLSKKVKREEISLDALEVSQHLDVALLLDASGSMAGQKIEDAKEAVVNFLDRLQGTIRLGLISFGDPNAHIRHDLTTDFSTIKSAVRKLSATGGTPMAEAISLAHTNILGYQGAINVMILLTDGQPNNPTTTEQAANTSKSKGVRIITIGVGSDVDSAFLRRIASAPEDYHFVGESFELSATFVNIATELSSGILGRR